MEDGGDILLVCASRTEAAPLSALLSRGGPAHRRGALQRWDLGRSRVWLLRTGITLQRARRLLRAVVADAGGAPAGRGPGNEPDEAAETALPALHADRYGGVAPAAERATGAYSAPSPAACLPAGTAPWAVIVFGIAGQLDPSVPVGSIVVPSLWRCQTSAVPLSCSPELLGLASRLERAWAPPVAVRPGGVGVTLQRPALGRAERILVRRRYPDATICDMETFAVIEQFPDAGCVAVRIVSDDGSEAAFSGRGKGRHSKIPASQFCALLPGIREQCATLALFIGDMVDALTAS